MAARSRSAFMPLGLPCGMTREPPFAFAPAILPWEKQRVKKEMPYPY